MTTIHSNDQRRYFDEFTSVDDVLAAFAEPPETVKDEEILFAWYEQARYEGYAIVVYRRDGKLFEVDAGHCSCRGLEGKWEPEETTEAALSIREPYALDGDALRAFQALGTKGES